MIKRILVPLDNSELSIRVLDVAFSIAGKFGADVCLLRIQTDLSQVAEGEDDLNSDVVQKGTYELLTAARGCLEDEHQLPADKVRVEVRAGSLITAIIEAAAEHRIDLVVMGTHGRSGITEMITGSTSEQIVAQLPTSVLIVKAAEL